MFEILTLAQTQKLSKKLLVILYGSEYWNEVFDLRPLVEWGAIDEKDLDLLCRVDTPDEAFEQLKKFLTAHHMVPATPQENARPASPRRGGDSQSAVDERVVGSDLQVASDGLIQ